ncbi:MAG TPA: Clp protease N-terminal domain-containing protein, partial [Solirubrobacteraceae bacterium]|nr:Clp protease N-terminal domain-containing protein [Solirubrobacteraceae bacterium]
MFENLTRFSEPGRRALTRANEHAQAAGDSYVRPEHLLLALAANPEESTAGRALQMFDVTAERLREELPAFTSPPEEAAALELPLDAALSELLASALCRTQQRTDETVTTMLMLLALAEQPTDASSVLERYGADADALGKVALTLQSETVVRPTGPSAHISAEPARSPAESTRTHETPDGSPSEPTSQPTSGPGAPPRSNPTPG